ncbi:MAG: hypothetical protein GWP05_01080 [Anaerolineaceae bacterium]|nr:hypothetical protein [Anaerolineaceae bacterium]
MLRRGRLTTALVIAALVVAGCQGGQVVREEEEAWPRIAVQGDSVQMFGPAALPTGGEDLGYFARVEAEEEPLMIWDYRAQFIRRRVWEVEDNWRPGQSYHREQTWSEETRTSYR